MPQSLTKIYLHIIFGTKDREPYINERISGELCAYITSILNSHDCKVVAINSPKGHFHVLCEMSKNHTIPEIVAKIKSNSSRWIKTKEIKLRNFQWQGGYEAFSVSLSALDGVKKYIMNQQEHHRRRTFQEEYLKFLEKHGLRYDERFIWE